MTARQEGPGGGDRNPVAAGEGGTTQSAANDPGAARTRRHRRHKLVVRITLVLLLCVMGGFHVVTERFANNVVRVPAVFDDLDPATRPAQPTGDAAQGLTFLIAGSDSLSSDATTGYGSPALSPGGQRSDLVMLARLSPDRDRAAVVSIPRDSWVEVPRHGMAKVNAAYSWGGPALMVETVEMLTGVRIDHFAVVDFAGFKTLVDAVGGIDVSVAGSADGDAADLVHLDGASALGYVRVRYGLPLGDLDRVRRQQNALRALNSRIAAGGLLADPVTSYALADAISRSVSVDDTLTNADLRSLAFGLRHLGEVVFATAPVADVGQEGPQSVVHLDHQRGAELWRALGEDRADQYLAAHPDDVLGDAPR